MCCRKGGTVSVPGVYIGFPDKLPFGAAMNKGLTFKMGQTHVQRYTGPLLEKIRAGEIDPSFVITHERPAREGARDVQDLPRQGGQLHQGRPEAVNLVDPGRHLAMASRSSSVEARVSAFSTCAICSRAWRFSSSVLEATQSPGTIRRKSRM